jgi:glycosyltransferase involved in cell wall biosynthesis
MRILVICESFGLGGTERAACTWAIGLVRRGHHVRFVAGTDGPRRNWLEKSGVEFAVAESSAGVAREIAAFSPDVIHEHVPGFLRRQNLGLDGRRKAGAIPLVQTNVFGRQDEMLTYRASGITSYISMTSAAQAFQRAGRSIRREDFDFQTVVPYPSVPAPDVSAVEAAEARRKWGLESGAFVIGRFGRPDWQKWSRLYEPICLRAAQRHPEVRFLFQAAPGELRERLANSPAARNCIFLEPTQDDRKLARAIAVCDAILHLSRIGESFGFSIAEAMQAGKPVIVNSSPDFDQAQLELIRHGIEGFHASSVGAALEAIRHFRDGRLDLATMGRAAKIRIAALANAEDSTDKLERVLAAAAAGGKNPFAGEDFESVLEAAKNLRRVSHGHALNEQLELRYLSLRGRVRNWWNRFKLR